MSQHSEWCRRKETWQLLHQQWSAECCHRQAIRHALHPDIQDLLLYMSHWQLCLVLQWSPLDAKTREHLPKISIAYIYCGRPRVLEYRRKMLSGFDYSGRLGVKVTDASAYWCIGRCICHTTTTLIVCGRVLCAKLSGSVPCIKKLKRIEKYSDMPKQITTGMF